MVRAILAVTRRHARDRDTETGRKRLDKSVRRAEKRGREARMMRIRDLLRTVPADFAAICASIATKYLIFAHLPAILTSNGGPLWACRAISTEADPISCPALQNCAQTKHYIQLVAQFMRMKQVPAKIRVHAVVDRVDLHPRHMCSLPDALDRVGTNTRLRWPRIVSELISALNGCSVEQLF